jgi:hypothetical protein
MKNLIKLTGVAFALTLSLAARADLISDGDFQTDTLGQGPGQDGDAWSFSGNTGANHGIEVYGGADLANPTDPSDPLTTNENFWDDGAVGSEAFISQTFATVAGDEYDISFWLNPAEDNDDVVNWDGVTVFSAVNGTTSGANAYVNGVLDGDTTQFQWNYITIDPMATPIFDFGLESTLELGIRNDPSYDGITGIDVEGVAGNNVPDAGPGFAVMVATLAGLCALSGRNFRRRIV